MAGVAIEPLLPVAMRCHPVRKTRKDRPDETDPPVILMAARFRHPRLRRRRPTVALVFRRRSLLRLCPGFRGPSSPASPTESRRAVTRAVPMLSRTAPSVSLTNDRAVGDRVATRGAWRTEDRHYRS